MMYICPACQKQEVDKGMRRCPNPACNFDLSPLAKFEELADAAFNRAVEADEDGDLFSAILSSSTALAIDGKDLEAKALLIDALRKSGAEETAESALEQLPDYVQQELRKYTVFEKRGEESRTRRKKIAWFYKLAVVGAAILLMGTWLVTVMTGERVSTDSVPSVSGAFNDSVLSGDNEPAIYDGDTSGQTVGVDRAISAEPQSGQIVTVYLISGDSYFALARRFYNDGLQWRKIAQANPDYPHPEDLPIGAAIRVPLEGNTGK